MIFLLFSSKNDPKSTASGVQAASASLVQGGERPAPKTVTSILSNIKVGDNAFHVRPNDSKSNVSPPGQAKKSNIPRPVTASNSFSAGNKNGPVAPVSRTASNASASRFSGMSKNTKAYVPQK